MPTGAPGYYDLDTESEFSGLSVVEGYLDAQAEEIRRSAEERMKRAGDNALIVRQVQRFRPGLRGYENPKDRRERLKELISKWHDSQLLEKVDELKDTVASRKLLKIQISQVAGLPSSLEVLASTAEPTQGFVPLLLRKKAKVRTAAVKTSTRLDVARSEPEPVFVEAYVLEPHKLAFLSEAGKPLPDPENDSDLVQTPTVDKGPVTRFPAAECSLELPFKRKEDMILLRVVDSSLTDYPARLAEAVLSLSSRRQPTSEPLRIPLSLNAAILPTATMQLNYHVEDDESGGRTATIQIQSAQNIPVTANKAMNIYIEAYLTEQLSGSQAQPFPQEEEAQPQKRAVADLFGRVQKACFGMFSRETGPQAPTGPPLDRHVPSYAITAAADVVEVSPVDELSFQFTQTDIGKNVIKVSGGGSLLGEVALPIKDALCKPEFRNAQGYRLKKYGRATQKPMLVQFFGETSYVYPPEVQEALDGAGDDAKEILIVLAEEASRRSGTYFEETRAEPKPAEREQVLVMERQQGRSVRKDALAQAIQGVMLSEHPEPGEVEPLPEARDQVMQDIIRQIREEEEELSTESISFTLDKALVMLLDEEESMKQSKSTGSAFVELNGQMSRLAKVKSRLKAENLRDAAVNLVVRVDISLTVHSSTQLLKEAIEQRAAQMEAPDLEDRLNEVQVHLFLPREDAERFTETIRRGRRAWQTRLWHVGEEESRHEEAEGDETRQAQAAVDEAAVELEEIEEEEEPSHISVAAESAIHGPSETSKAEAVTFENEIYSFSSLGASFTASVIDVDSSGLTVLKRTQVDEEMGTTDEGGPASIGIPFDGLVCHFQARQKPESAPPAPLEQPAPVAPDLAAEKKFERQDTSALPQEEQQILRQVEFFSWPNTKVASNVFMRNHPLAKVLQPNAMLTSMQRFLLLACATLGTAFVGALFFTSTATALHIPTDLLYTTDDQWIKVFGDLESDPEVSATVGLTDYRQSVLGDVIFVGQPVVGIELKPGGLASEIETMTRLIQLKAPIGGTVSETNRRLDDAAYLINDSPYTEGWLYNVSVWSLRERQRLRSSFMNAISYNASLQQKILEQPVEEEEEAAVPCVFEDPNEATFQINWRQVWVAIFSIVFSVPVPMLLKQLFAKRVVHQPMHLQDKKKLIRQWRRKEKVGVVLGFCYLFWCLFFLLMFCVTTSKLQDVYDYIITTKLSFAQKMIVRPFFFVLGFFGLIKISTIVDHFNGLLSACPSFLDWTFLFANSPEELIESSKALGRRLDVDELSEIGGIQDLDMFT
ncbi:unnamed protein product [Vitrella brassicaformis CCMP3155]|uniref:Uncharacterized protein n=1 Tax=Vitrella brassicaformis (strain CCMP3155) TaxID=1169540 RepID=A0A0G4FE04_VITBC|nr:unnamed protein product [Vitrella brassicaformis CCMP3155]|eukprot:CEM11189.1 unnamed protein product [Vitrella brassicaformis CCMP3155]